MSGHVEGAVPDGRAFVTTAELAEAVRVPQSVFAYLEARLATVRAVRDGAGRAYRAGDAVLLAGLADLLYRDGAPLREVMRLMGAERETVLARGRALLGDVAVPRRTPPQRPIPDDAVVAAGGESPAAAVPRRPSAPVAAVLGELIDCIRLLDEARRGDASA